MNKMSRIEMLGCDEWEMEAQYEIRRLITKLNQQMESILKQFPLIRVGNSTDKIPDFSSLDGFVGFPQISDIDLGKGNTTSETKIIDGHKVVINQTEYHKDSANGSAFFKVRVIDVKPTDTSSEEIAPTTSASKDAEALENSVENEIQKNNEVGTKGAPEKLRAI